MDWQNKLKIIKKDITLSEQAKIKQKKKYPINEVLSILKYPSADKQYVEFDGDLININTQTMQMFKVYGTNCKRCGAKGEFFIKEKNVDINTYSLNLYGLKNDEYVKITKDHILPKAKGGPDVLANFDPLCEKCNCVIKADTIIEAPLEKAMLQIAKEATVNNNSSPCVSKSLLKLLITNLKFSFKKVSRERLVSSYLDVALQIFITIYSLNPIIKNNQIAKLLEEHLHSLDKTTV